MPITGMGQESSNWIAALAGRKQSRLGDVTLRKSATGTVANVATAAKPVAVDRGRMSVQHILVTKSTDLQGDIVDPAGADLSAHEANPVVFYDHREHYKHPIGRAENENAYTVRKSANGELLYAETFFSPKDEVSNQLFGLVAEDMLRGWSVGFNPIPGHFETIRKSTPGNRGAFKFNRYTLLEYSLTPQPVNPDALTVLIEKGRFGSEPLNELIKKSLTPYTLQNRAATVRVPAHPLTVKAMNDDMTAQPGANDDPYAQQDGDGQADGQQEFPTVAALYDAAQGIMDICSNLEQTVAGSEHKGGKSFAGSVCAAGQKLAAKIKGKADAIKSELAGEETAEGDEKPAEDGDEDLETEDDGEIVTKGGYRPKRWTTKGIQLANRPLKIAKPEHDPTQLEALKNQLEAINTKLSAVA
jgi:phage head maturation protease